MKVLITGVAGLLGSRLAGWLMDNVPNIKVVGIDNFFGGYIDNVPKKVVCYQNSIEDGVDHIFQREKPDYVFHFAAYAAEGLSPFMRKFNYTNNLLATAEIINCCINHEVKRLVFTSSMAVYGQGNPPFDEKDIPNPIDPYGIAKYACEMDIRVAGEQHGLDWCIIRPHNVYGINQNLWDKYRNVLGIWMRQTKAKESMTIFGDGEQKRAFSFIDDCLLPLWKAAILPEASKEIINLGGTKEYTINEANQILRAVMKEGEVVYKEGRHEVKTAHPTWEKSVRILGYEDKTSLKKGLKQMWKWAKNQPDREQFKWLQYEVEKGIYSFWKN